MQLDSRYVLSCEVHVYATATEVGNITVLVQTKDERISKENGYQKISVIAAVGSRIFYQKRGDTVTGVKYLK